MDQSEISGATGVVPVTYGTGDRPPRGDYSKARRDYTCEQDMERYTASNHDTYRRLFQRQVDLLPGLACAEFVNAVGYLGKPDRIPTLGSISTRLTQATGWRLVAVPGLIPEAAFFSLLAEKRFPITEWIREAGEFDYVVEPDFFHDLFGHVPLLFDPVFSSFIQAYGLGGMKADRLNACELLSRLYWYTVEFGLIRTSDGLRAYGAGLLSSGGELAYCVNSNVPLRHAFDLRRTMLTKYRIDSYQSGYFTINSFQELFDATKPDFTSLYEEIFGLIRQYGELDVGDPVHASQGVQ